jgi:hypothetical protein
MSKDGILSILKFTEWKHRMIEGKEDKTYDND